MLDLLRAMALQPMPVGIDDRGMLPDELEAPWRAGSTRSYHHLAGDTRGWVVVRSVSRVAPTCVRPCWPASGRPSAASRDGCNSARLGERLLQQTVAELWANPATASQLQTAADTYRRRREALLAALEDRGIQASGRSGLNVWVPVPEETSVVAGLQQAGWAVRAGRRYRLDSPPAVRVTTAALAAAR